MKSFVAAGVVALAHSQSAVATTALPWNVAPGQPGCPTVTITAAELTKPCGSFTVPCPVSTNLGDSELHVCGKLFKLGFKYPDTTGVYNSTIYAKVARRHGTTTTPEWLISPMGWTQLCPFVAGTGTDCKPFAANATDFKKGMDGGHGFLVPGSADTLTQAIPVQWQSVDTDPAVNGGTAGNINETPRLPTLTMAVSNWTSTDTACTGQSFTSEQAWNYTSCGSTRLNPCPAYGNFTCGSIWSAKVVNPGFNDDADDGATPPVATPVLCTGQHTCTASTSATKFFRIVRTGEPVAPLNATLVVSSSTWRQADVCPHLCKLQGNVAGGNMEVCATDAAHCLTTTLQANTTFAAGTWGTIPVAGSLKAENTLILQDLTFVSSSVRAAGVSALAALLIAVGISAAM